MPLPRRLLALLPSALAGCAMATPFRPAGETSLTEDGAVVGVTHAVLSADVRLHPLFWTHIGRIEAALPSQPGYLGHSKRTTLLRDQAWTMSVWRSASDMEMFVESHEHVVAIHEAMPAIARARFARFRIAPGDMPPRWGRALAALEERSRNHT